jgi:hypothetical protein
MTRHAGVVKQPSYLCSEDFIYYVSIRLEYNSYFMTSDVATGSNRNYTLKNNKGVISNPTNAVGIDPSPSDIRRTN